MSLFSRFFRKTPSRAPTLPPASRSTPPKEAEEARAAERARVAADEAQAVQSAIASRDEQALARLVVAGTSSRTRQAAAAAVEDPDLLRQLIRDVRGDNDKGVYKILTSKRDARLEHARQREQLQAEINAAAEDLERHSQRGYDALYAPRLTQFERAWHAVEAQADPALRDSVQQWVDRARQIVAEHLQQAEAAAAREAAAASAAAEAQRLREEQAQAAAAVAAEQARELEAQERAVAEERQATRQIGDLIRKAKGALSDGNTSRAAGVRRAIEEKLAGAPPLPAHMAGQIQQIDQQLTELKDWKSFSVAPKRAELIEAMESLVGAELDPLALAERIKGLQDEWRTLSQGAGENHEADWQRFHEAAQKAYQPCSEYFAAQAVIREENLKRREAVLEKLAAFESGIHWEQPDWRAVTHALREAKQEWRSITPVEPRAGRRQQEKFSAVITNLQGRLDAEHARNKAQKALLIERARQLLESDDHRKAVDAIKGLQQAWQGTGPVPRDVDQRLWGEFRQHCDAVFQKRQQASAAFTASLENNKAQAIALCEQIEQIAALEGAELLARAGERVELRKAFDALGEFPRADSRALQNRLDQALDRCEKALARQRARDAEQTWADLFEAANHVRDYRLAVASGADPEQREALKQTAETHMTSVQRWPKGGLDAFKAALSSGERAEDLAANEAALRMLCIRAEILTDTPTPSDDQALRRDYQLQRLVQGMGQGVKADEASLDGLAIEWVNVGPVSEAVYKPLLQRFQRCREQGG